MVIFALALQTVNAVITVITAVGTGEDVIQALVMTLDGTRGEHWAGVKPLAMIRQLIFLFAEVFPIAGCTS